MIFTPQFNGGDAPLSEYPRPQFKRQSYLSLNGRWEYAFTSSAALPAAYEGTILVPYSPESKLSGVGRQLKPGEFLHYRRTFELPEGFFRGRVLLNFGACDQVCKVYVNGAEVGGHKGGYLPFTFDITAFLREGCNELCVAVEDDASSHIYGRGKQSYNRGGIWYTAISGIWQSVWLESVPQNHIKKIRLSPDYAANTLTIESFTQGEGAISCAVYDGDRLVCSAEGVPCNVPCVLNVSDCKPWTPDSPELYTVKMTFGQDEVESYFGLRTFSRKEIGGRQYFALNGMPVFQSGLLDQGYWGDGIYTPKANREMYDCIQKVKSLGFNMLRKHIKVEPLLWYYYCDISGILVWQDMVNGGERYKKYRINLGPFIDLHLNDKNFKSMGRADERSRRQYMDEARGTVDALYNCTCICLWTPFNEGWGQFDSLNVWQALRAEDDTRLYDHASGWQDMGGGDLCSRHVYFKKARLKNDGRRILALTEFGGYSYRTAKAGGRTFSYRSLGSQAAFMAALKKLYMGQIVPLIRNQSLCAAVYTQLSDVEDEVNGLFTPDWQYKADAEEMRAINAALYAAFGGLFSKG